MNKGQDEYFIPESDITKVSGYLFRQSVIISGLFVVPGLVLICYWLLAGWPNVEARSADLTVIISSCAVVAGAHSAWRPVRTWINRPVVRRIQIFEDWLFYREECIGRRPFVVRESRLPLSDRTVAIVMERAIVLRSAGSDLPQLASISVDDFLDERARDGFLEMLRSRGVQFTDKLMPIFTGPKQKRRIR